MKALFAVLLGASAVLLTACNLPPPTHDALYPPDEAGLSANYIVTHDRYYPWAFQPLDTWGRGR
jgi:hypothetical protein